VFSPTIRARLILTNVLLLVVWGSSLLYLRVNIARSGDAIAAQRVALERLQTINDAAQAFGALRYWLTDLAVSQLNESENLARQMREELERHLEALPASDSARTAEIRAHVANIWTNSQDAAKAYLDDNRVLGNSLLAQSRQSSMAVSALIQALGSEQQATAKRAGETVLDGGEASTRLSLILLSIAIGASFCLTWATVRAITRRIAQIMSALQAMAKGDLTAELDTTGKDEIAEMGRALYEGIRRIAKMVREVHATASHVTSASQQLAMASEHLSAGALEQASSVEETSASLEQLSATVKENAESARQASQFAAGSRDLAETGGQVVTAAVHAMGEISGASRRIADIIAAIDEIAFQTNLLALNAAVEAARAGEQGRGFAVVAGEVRTLAQRSAAAAKEIKALIQDSVQRVQDGSVLVNRSGLTLEEIVASVKRAADLIGNIAAVGQEQSSGIDQVSRAVSQMDQVIQANSVQTEEVSATAQVLAAKAAELQALVERFKLEEGVGQARAVESDPLPPPRFWKTSKKMVPPPRAGDGSPRAQDDAFHGLRNELLT
jgi:methyl-accepting chemotaxis protein